MERNLNLFEKPIRLIKNQNDINDIESVISENDLKTSLEKFCADVKCPITLFSFYDVNEKGDMKRFDSAISTVSLHYCCETFRKCAGPEYCKKCDIDHASLFKGDKIPFTVSEMNNSIISGIEKYINEDKENRIYYNEKAPAPEFIPFESIGGFLKFYCPMLGFEEHVFPIIVSDRVLGVIYCGQIQSKGNRDIIGKDIRKHFINKNKKLFDDYFKKYRSEISKKTQKKILKDLIEGNNLYKASIPSIPINSDYKNELIDDGLVNKRDPMKLSIEQYNELINDIQKALKELTITLEESMKINRKEYIEHIVKNKIFSFYKDVIDVSVSPNDRNGITNYWRLVEISLIDIVKKLSLHSINVYGAIKPHSEIDEDCSFLELVVNSIYDDNESNKIYNKDKDDYHFKINKEDKRLQPFITLNNFQLEHLCVKGNDALCNRIYPLKESIHEELSECMNILFYPVKENLHHSSAMVINCFKRTNSCNYLKDSSFIEHAIMMELYLFSNMIFYVSSYLLDSLLQATTEMVLRFFKHELSHVLLGYNYLNEKYIKNFNYFKNLDDDRRQDVQGDFLSTEQMLRAIANNIELLIKPKEEIKIVHEEFKIFKELFYKWDKMYRHDRKYRNLYFDTPHITLDDPDRPLINSDKRLLEQIVYNIVHNAVKYSYWGTIIKIDCKRKNKSEIRQIFSVTDYGAEVIKSFEVYDLYFRGNDIKKTIEGSGIGLYIVKKISELLGFEITTPICNEVSRYNIGVIDAYISNINRKNIVNDILVKELKEEIKRLGDKYYQMVNKNKPKKRLTELEINDMIREPTYEVIFEVII